MKPIDPACDLIVTAAEVELERGDQPVACSVVRGLDRNVIDFVPLPPLNKSSTSPTELEHT